jgi:hypothetical protein
VRRSCTHETSFVDALQNRRESSAKKRCVNLSMVSNLKMDHVGLSMVILELFY